MKETNVRKFMFIIIVFIIGYITGNFFCKSKQPEIEPITAVPCEMGPPINILGVRFADQYNNPIDNAFLEIYDFDPNWLDLEEKRFPLWQGLIENGSIKIDYTFETCKDYYFLVLKKGYEPTVISFRVPALKNLTAIHPITNETIGMKYDFPEVMRVNKLGTPVLNIRKDYDTWSKRNRTSDIPKIFTEAEFYLWIESKDGFLRDAYLIVEPYVPIITGVYSSGDDLSLYRLKSYNSLGKYFDKKSIYHFYVHGEDHPMRICLDDYRGETRWFRTAQGNFIRYDVNPSCVDIYLKR